MFALVATLHCFIHALCFMAAVILSTYNLAALVVAAFTYFSVKSNSIHTYLDIEDEACVNTLLATTPELDSDSETSATYSSDDSSDTWSLSSATSEESADYKSSPFFADSPICSEERNFWECETEAESNIVFNAYAGFAPHVTVQSSIPERIVEDLTMTDDETSDDLLSIVVVDIDNLDELDNYSASCLTPRAREEAIRRSNAVRRDARRAYRIHMQSLAKKPVKKVQQHPEPSSHRSRAVLKALSRPSRLQTSWTMADVDAEIAQEEEDARLCAEEEEDVVVELGSWPSTTFLKRC